MSGRLPANPDPIAPSNPDPDGGADRESGLTARAADAAWGLVRRIHLGTRQPGNWMQLFQFAVVGASGYVINLVVFALLTELAGVHHVLAAVGAFCVAVTNNFALNRIWTFRSQGAREHHAGFQAARFFAVSVVGLTVNLIVLTALVDGAGVRELPSQAVAVAVATPVNFVGNKLWTFGRARLGG
ncbi:MAG TPA: GtrA family protein [Solirubrobacterales bacterium]|nr:GtrA family protein [Solirubrobacterales bacterium]